MDAILSQDIYLSVKSQFLGVGLFMLEFIIQIAVMAFATVNINKATKTAIITETATVAKTYNLR